MRKAIFVAAMLPLPARAEVPPATTYSGYVEEAGAPVEGTRDMTFRIFDAPDGVAPLFEELHDAVPLSGGLFTVGLGEGLGDDLFDATLWSGAELWLEIDIDGTVLAPRQPVRSVPYAIRANEADMAATADMAETAGSADTADLATLAEDALALEGLAAAAFAPAAHAHGPACTATQKVIAFNPDGTLLCAADIDTDTDTDTTYTAGDGLALSPGEVFAVDGTVSRAGHTHAESVPAGMIAFFAGACPAGWTEYGAAQGRFVLGLVAGGSVEEVGGASTHAHAYTDVVAHSHGVDPPAAATTSDGLHTHTLPTSGGGSTVPSVQTTANMGGLLATTTDGTHAHTVDIAAFASDPTGVASATTATVDHTPPYIALRACTKD